MIGITEFWLQSHIPLLSTPTYLFQGHRKLKLKSSQLLIHCQKKLSYLNDMKGSVEAFKNDSYEIKRKKQRTPSISGVGL